MRYGGNFMGEEMIPKDFLGGSGIFGSWRFLDELYLYYCWIFYCPQPVANKSFPLKMS